jgi:hypothetical protein
MAQEAVGQIPRSRRYDLSERDMRIANARSAGLPRSASWREIGLQEFHLDQPHFIDERENEVWDEEHEVSLSIYGRGTYLDDWYMSYWPYTD